MFAVNVTGVVAPIGEFLDAPTVTRKGCTNTTVEAVTEVPVTSTAVTVGVNDPLSS
jgi:hypothetical protein